MLETTSAVKILRKRTADKPELRRIVARERRNLKVASLVYEARTTARLTQKDLATKIGTQQSVIARIEDADYRGGHSLSMLDRIAEVLDLELTVEFKPRITTVHV